MAKNDVYIRSFSGLIFVAIVVCATVFSFATLFVITLFISSVCLVEFLNIRKTASFIQYTFVHTNNAVLITAASGIWPAFTPYAIPISIAIFLIYFTVQLFRQGIDIMQTIVDPVFAVFYITLPFVCFILFSKQGEAYNWQRPLLIFILVWASDTFAYVAGRLFGRTYLFPALSPKKTVEGWVGGTLLAAAAGGIMAYFWPFIGMFNGIALGVLVSLFGTMGDLFESALKRNAGVKDTGKILPGHGGLLDRFDAFIFAAVIVYAWYVFVG